MKHFNFSLGLATGAAIGTIVSLLQFKDGRRLGQPLQDQAQITKDDISSLKQAVTDLKQARQELSAALPGAKEMVIELQNDLEYYQMGINRIIAALQQRIEQLNEDPDNHHSQ